MTKPAIKKKTKSAIKKKNDLDDKRHNRRRLSDVIVDEIKDTIDTMKEDIAILKECLIGSIPNKKMGFIAETHNNFESLKYDTKNKVDNIKTQLIIQWWLISVIAIAIIGFSFK